MVVFDRPTGAPADVKELEYISGLHQTAQTVRIDGSINAEDIQLYLKSRFGIEVELNVVTNTILQGMGGSADEAEVIDLMEMTAILLIPYLVKAARLQRGQALPEGVQSVSPHTIKHVCQMMLHDLRVNQDQGGNDDDDDENEANNPILSNQAPPLTKSLIQKILHAYGEDDLAADDDLCQEMLDMTAGHEVLDAAALAQALTADVQLYNLDNERRYASLYQDVFSRGNNQPKDQNAKELDQDQDDNNDDDADDDDEIPLLKHTFTAPAIDSTAGTYRSKTLLICLWAGTLFAYFAAPTRPDVDLGECDPYNVGGTWADNAKTMQCETGSAIVFWILLFFQVCVFGILWVGCGSCGNQQDGIRCWKPICGGGFLFVVVVVGFIDGQYEGETSENGEVQAVRAEYTPNERYVRIVGLLLGIVVICFHTLHCVEICARDDRRRKTILNQHAFQDEVNHKAAMHYKINKMVNNAVEIHHSDDKQNIVKTCFGHALHVYSKWHKTERIGGLVWAWKQIWSGKIFHQEGIWYSARLIAANMSQYIVVLYILLSGIYYIHYVQEEVDEEDAKTLLRNEAERIIWSEVSPEDVNLYSAQIAAFLGDFMANMTAVGLLEANCDGAVATGSQILADTCSQYLGCSFLNDTQSQTDIFCALMTMSDLTPEEQLTLMDGAGLDANLILDQVRIAMETSIDNSVESLYPSEDYMITVPISIGVVVAVFTSLFLAVSYLPSITSTTLQLRTGVIPTLAEQKLNQYRAAPDTVTMLTGSLFWGCLFSGVLVGGLIGGVAFLFLWQGSIYYVQKMVAIVIGIIVIALIRIGIMCYGRHKYFKSFYRKKPAAANIYFLAMEWANFALTAGFVFVRLVKLLIVAGVSVGRIDTRFLAKGVGELGPLELDPFPTIHMRDIMSHDSHRHPYIEALGNIYLMKLRHGRKFCSNAGSCWRLIFVYALMPWMQRYRIFDAPGVKHLDEEGNVDLDERQVSDQLRELNLQLNGSGTLMDSFAVAPRLLATTTTGSAKDATILRLRNENEELKKAIAKLQQELNAAQGNET